MNIIEAIKSGRRFKRKNWDFEIMVSSNTLYPFYVHNNATCHLSFSDIIADDWEVEEEKIEITKAQLINALNFVRDKYEVFSYHNVWEILKDKSKCG